MRALGLDLCDDAAAFQRAQDFMMTAICFDIEECMFESARHSISDAEGA